MREEYEHELPKIKTRPTTEEIAVFKEKMLAVGVESGCKGKKFRDYYKYHARLKQAYRSLVYFLQVIYDDGTPGPIKIGCSCQVRGRRCNIQTDNPHEVRLIATITGFRDVEAAWHERFAGAHRRGEWFDPVPELVLAIQETLTGGTDGNNLVP